MFGFDVVVHRRVRSQPLRGLDVVHWFLINGSCGSRCSMISGKPEFDGDVPSRVTTFTSVVGPKAGLTGMIGGGVLITTAIVKGDSVAFRSN